MLQKSPRRSCRIKIRNNRIGANGYLNQRCALTPDLEFNLTRSDGQNSFGTQSGAKADISRRLRRVLALYSSYYNESRTHLALEKDAPVQKLSRGAE